MDISDSILGRIRKVARLTDLVLQEQLAPLNITLAEFRLVGLLLGSDGVQAKDLADNLGISPASLSVTLQKLLQKNILLKSTDPHDKRASLIVISPELDLGPIQEIIARLEQQALAELENPKLLKQQLDQVITKLAGDQR